jgi:hypothetical protein
MSEAELREELDEMFLNQRIVKLEAKLAEANEAARLQRAIGRIEAAGYFAYALTTVLPNDRFMCRVQPSTGTRLLYPDYFYGATWAEAAEKAAEWAESQKEAAHE